MIEKLGTIQPDTLEFSDKESLSKLKEETDQYINSVKESMQEVYGKIPAEFSAQIRQLRDLYLTYLKASYKLEEQQPVVAYTNKTIGLNQQLVCVLRVSQLINALVKNFGLSPLDKSKLKQNNTRASAKNEVTSADEVGEDFMSDF